MLCVIFLMHEARQRGQEQKGSDHLLNCVFCARVLVWISLVYDATSYLHIVRSDVTLWHGKGVTSQGHIVYGQAAASPKSVASRPLGHRLGRALGTLTRGNPWDFDSGEPLGH